jgi:hypothetical protein
LSPTATPSSAKSSATETNRNSSLIGGEGTAVGRWSPREDAAIAENAIDQFIARNGLCSRV